MHARSLQSFLDASLAVASKYVKGILSRSELKFPNTSSERDMPDIHIHGTSKKQQAQANEHVMYFYEFITSILRAKFVAAATTMFTKFSQTLVLLPQSNT
eukprot:scaffold401_cov144-Skeletonema_dohrnii-CCMP3373.AAC.4